MKKTALLMICLAFLTAFLSCGRPINNGGSDAAVSPETEWAGMQNVNLNAFDRFLIDYLWENGYYSSNFVVSPVSFRTSLCLAAAGAKGDTRAELVSAAGFTSMDELNLWRQICVEKMTQYTGDFSAASGAFYAVNSICNNKNLLGNFADSYTMSVQAQYGADVIAAEDLTEEINKWIDNKTDGAIPAIAEKLSGASMALVSAMYMKPLWLCGFPGSATHEGVFTARSGEESTVEFMEQTGRFFYAEENGTKIVVLPVMDSLSFVFFLGNRVDMLQKLPALKSETVCVVIPRFTMRSDLESNELLNFLVAKGVTDAFHPLATDFGGMCDDADWFLQVVLGTAQLTVDKAGIETGTDKADKNADLKEFVADCPFEFAVFSNFGLDDQQMLLYGQMMTAQ